MPSICSFSLPGQATAAPAYPEAVLNSLRRARATTVARLFTMAIAAGLLFAAIAVPTVAGIGVLTKTTISNFDHLSVPKLGLLPVRSEIYDRTGRLITYYYPNGIDRVPVTYDQISEPMRQAILAIEDARFYQHGAIDPKGTIRALVNNLEHKAVQGGSTLAQQYVKNALVLTARTKQERADAISETPARKLRELRMAINVEHELTKDELLAAYLSVAYFNNQAYGVQIAAQRYFHTTAKKLTLAQSALLAGIVENPSRFNPLEHPGDAKARRNIVLQRMLQLHDISKARAQRAMAAPLGLDASTTQLQEGCSARSTKLAKAAFFCDYVLSVMRQDPAYHQAYQAMNQTGGLKIFTTLDPVDQHAAQHAVNYMLPPPPSQFNPAGNAATEVLIQPGTGRVRAIALDRPYGTGPGQTNVNYAVDTKFNGGAGVQTGSSSKLFTLLTALKQGIPFGFNLKVSSPESITGYTNCKGQPITTPYLVNNSEGPSKPEAFTLYNGTTMSINVFYAHLEQQVGLCNVVKTAASLGVHRANGTSLFDGVGKPGSANYQYPADDIPSFTLGSVNVSPMTMAAAYAAVAARGVYCSPIAIQRIVDRTGEHLPVKSADCHRVLSPQVADAATHILQGVLVSPGTAAGDQFTQHGVVPPQAGKTGTANDFDFAAFGGFTPRLAGYVVMFYPPRTRSMAGPNSCYRLSSGSFFCAGEMFGANSGQIWQYTFQHARLGKSIAQFVPVPGTSAYYSLGDGVNSPKPPKKKGHGHGGGGGGGGGNGNGDGTGPGSGGGGGGDGGGPGNGGGGGGVNGHTQP
jgi:membrane peptidoglycan carboxypeptidase